MADKYKFLSYLVMGVAELFTWIPLAMFAVFLFSGPFLYLNLSLNHMFLLLFDAGLSFVFFLQHSLMIRKPFHAWLEKQVPSQLHRGIFAGLSGSLLLLLILSWQPSDIILTEIKGWVRWVLRGIFLLSVMGFIRAGKMLPGLDTSGVKRIKRFLNEEKEPVEAFTVSGPYKWVRHPLYFFTFLMIWTFPDISTDRLLFNILWTCWIVVGAHFEEKDLLETFGDPYRKYQKQVPMLIPSPFKKLFKPHSEAVFDKRPPKLPKQQ